MSEFSDERNAALISYRQALHDDAALATAATRERLQYTLERLADIEKKRMEGALLHKSSMRTE